MKRLDHPLMARGLKARHDRREILHGLDVAFPAGGLTVIVGPNACGKSTLLRSLARLHPTSDGAVLLDGSEIAGLRQRDLARRLAVLPQGAEAPDGITVADLVSRGRHPHQGLFRRWSSADEAAVADAMAATGVAALASRLLHELSGGQRQKVWIAMALAQATDILLLDEPTTFLDIAHQIEILELCRSLSLAGKTLVAVLHDLNQACRYATNLVAMKEGAIAAQGAPAEIVTAELVQHVFGIACIVIADPITGTPMIVPGRSQGGVPAR
ncbi:MAG TPA: ABC transporter ATP-binding protein [Bosea sp. (in: a-proteobacteria)]|jgi:iron complex transport system ATP-binding protein|uniref:ABC transporter ATP-binding protein n=1 Tax=Bosea sp. (in: a-proteobacteria) TaxID=1871050 RepID=UPI002E0F8649|nr:ABC transporter ATP-binding protein [Bosea sp. (in: a-proteobacteria)]